MPHFVRVAAFSVLVAIALAWATPPVGAQKKKEGKDSADSTPATPADYKTLQKAKELTGTIVSVSGSAVILKVDYPHIEPNPKFKPSSVASKANTAVIKQYQQAQELERIQRDYKRAMTAKNPQDRARAAAKYQYEVAQFNQRMEREYKKLVDQASKDPNLAKNNANNTTDPLIVVHSYKEYELELQDKVVLRKLFLPFEFDDSGKPREYTEKEKAELKGTDKTKPGYSAKIEEATPGTEAKLHLTAPKNVEKPKASKDDPDGIGNVERPTVNMMVLTKENRNSSTGAADKKKKDKK